MSATMTDLTNAARRAWDAASTEARTQLIVGAGALVLATEQPDSAALGIVEGMILAQGLDEKERRLIIVGLIAHAHGWKI